MGNDELYCCIGVTCLAVGTPILAAGIFMLVLGSSGGALALDLCCTELTYNGPEAVCSRYVTSPTCSGFPLAAVPTAQTLVTSTLEKVRTDTSYNLYLELPRGVSITSTTARITEVEGTGVYSGSFSESSAAPTASQACDDVTATGYPAAQRILLKRDWQPDDAGGVKLEVEATVTDATGVLVSNPLGKPFFTPNVIVDKDGLGTLQVWGIVLIVIGGMIVTPPACVIFAALQS